MKLIFIENNDLLSKIVTYLDYSKIEYTTNINDKFDTLIIAQNNKKTLELMKKSKKVIYIAYLDELKISNNFMKKNKKCLLYKSKMNDFFSKCNVVITSLPYFKKIINAKKVVVIPLENLCIGLCKNKIFNFKKKSITIIDSNYEYINQYIDLVNDNYSFELIGYNPQKKISDLPVKLKLHKYCNERLLQNYIVNSNLIIFFDNILSSQNYLNICLNLKKNILLLNSNLCNDYFVDNKNIYLFNLDNFEKKYNKIIKNRVSNLGINGYELIKNNDFEGIADKFCKLLK